MNDAAIITAFSEDQVERLTGISQRQLRYWDQTDFFKPSLASDNRREAFSRVYSFKDVASLRVLAALRKQHDVSLQHLRKVAKELPQMSDAKWTSTQLFVLDKRVVFVEPGSKQYREIVSKQYVMGPSLAVAIADTKKAIEKLRQRHADDIGQITKARNVSHNAWVIAGTRIPVTAIKRFAEDGYSVDAILKEYPTLTEADIEAALAHEGGSGLAA